MCKGGGLELLCSEKFGTRVVSLGGGVSLRVGEWRVFEDRWPVMAVMCGLVLSVMGFCVGPGTRTSQGDALDSNGGGLSSVLTPSACAPVGLLHGAPNSSLWGNQYAPEGYGSKWDYDGLQNCSIGLVVSRVRPYSVGVPLTAHGSRLTTFDFRLSTFDFRLSMP